MENRVELTEIFNFILFTCQADRQGSFGSCIYTFACLGYAFWNEKGKSGPRLLY